MECSRCGNTIGTMGAPHCESIKIQYECACGQIECEYYTPDEMRENERIAAGEGARTVRARGERYEKNKKGDKSK